MATKDEELIEEIETSLRAVDGGLVAIRTAQKALGEARDTLRFAKTVIETRKSQEAARNDLSMAHRP